LFGQAERIITLSPSLSEIVFGLGKEKEIVGVSSYASYPSSMKKLPKVGGYFSPSLETILSLRPTLIIGQNHHQHFLQKLKRIGIPILMVKLDSLDAIQKAITTIAKQLETSGKVPLEAIQKALHRAKKLSRTSKKVLITFGTIKSPTRDVMFIAGQNSFFNDIIKACGAKNAFPSKFKAEPRLRFENLIALNPDSIIMLSSPLTDGKPDKKAIMTTWSKLPIKASQNHHIHILDDDYLLIPSHRVALTITKLCEAIHQ
jgi:iron complex transport system substrate-binding protein